MKSTVIMLILGASFGLILSRITGTGKPSTAKIDKMLNQAVSIQNFKIEKEMLEGGGQVEYYTGIVGKDTIKMVTVNLPDFVGSQTTSMQLIVNGRQELAVPIKLPYQVFDKPIIIEDKVVVRISSGMYDTEDRHYYLVADNNHKWYVTNTHNWF